MKPVDLRIGGLSIVELGMANLRRLTINPPLTDAEFAGLCAANPGLKIDREPTGVIFIRRKRKERRNYGDWLLSQRGTVSSEIDLDDAETPSVGTEVHYITKDTETLRALEVLEGRLIREREISEGAHATALNVAIRALASHIDILESPIEHELGIPPKVTGRDMDTYDRRRKFLTDAGQPVEKALEVLGRDPAERIVAEGSVAASQIISAFIANSKTHAFGLSDRDIRLLLDMIKNPPAPNEKLRQAVRQYLTAIADPPTSDTQSVSEIRDTE
jgi:uncharacterized protein (DUF1778 family)